MNVYLDNSATTRVAKEVIDAILPYFSGDFGNAQSVHAFGQRAKSALEDARRQVAALLNAAPAEVVFVSGGTEADNLAIRGIAEAHQTSGRHLITTKIEHPAVLAMCEALEQRGYRVTYLPVSRRGLVDLEEVRRAICDETILISVMLANNETGTIQPLEEIAGIVRERRALGHKHLHLHTDAVQAVGKIVVNVEALGVDLLSLSGHKIHAPKGVGALYIRKGTRLEKLFYGGHHERDKRPGTENVPGIVGLGKACELARLNLTERTTRMRELRDAFEQRVLAEIPYVEINGDSERRVPNICNLSFAGLDGESLLIALDLRGIAVSTGSACASGSLEPSHVLTALGLERAAVRGSLRISLSAYTTREELDFTVDALKEITERLRQMRPSAEAEASGVSVI